MNSTGDMRTKHDVIIVGGGAAGVGAGLALQYAGIDRFVVIDRHQVGASFSRWPAETRFITPSFPTNSIGMLDLNSIAIGVSPAFSLEVEHPTGAQYASHLQAVARHFKLPVQDGVNVSEITKDSDGFVLHTSSGPLHARHVIWAAGEFLYPRLFGFVGSTLCRHTATIPSYDDLEGDDFIVIGGYESGIDAAYHLARRGKRVRVFDKGSPWQSGDSDPSCALSTYSLERMREPSFAERVELFPDTPITLVKRVEERYEVATLGGQRFRSPAPPLLAGGFKGSHNLIEELFEVRGDGFPMLNAHDESTITPGLFLCGPAVRHDNHVFCFIYKYRQRFPVVAKAIATALGLPAEKLEEYRRWGMYLDDLSICGDECVC